MTRNEELLQLINANVNYIDDIRKGEEIFEVKLKDAPDEFARIPIWKSPFSCGKIISNRIANGGKIE